MTEVHCIQYFGIKQIISDTNTKRFSQVMILNFSFNGIIGYL